MRHSLKKRPAVALLMAGLTVLLVVMLPLAVKLLRDRHSSLPGLTNITGNTSASGQQTTAGGSLISRGIPAFASSGYSPASQANDASYDTAWRSQGAPCWLAYDLSSVPATKRSSVLLVWYNQTGNYDHTLINTPAYNLPQDYTIEANTAAGGTNPPATGWTTLVTVSGNHYHSRQHLLSLKNFNWVRIHVTAIDGSVENEDASINMDLFDASTALANDWIFFGDSITAGAMNQQTLNGTASFAQLINDHAPNLYPVQEGGGIPYLTSTEGAKYLASWLALFPGKYVGLSYGSNDALGCVNATTFYNHYLTMVQDVLHAGKVPIVPHIPWGRRPNVQQCASVLNAQIDALYRAFPQIIHGPDLWSFFKNHQDLISNDDLHPNDAGYAAYREQWANTLLMEVYKR